MMGFRLWLQDLGTKRGGRMLHPTSLHIFYRAQERSERFEGHSSSNSLTGHPLSRPGAQLTLQSADTILPMTDDRSR